LTKELLERLHSYTCAADAHLEAFRLATDAIEAMQARCFALGMTGREAMVQKGTV